MPTERRGMSLKPMLIHGHATVAMPPSGGESYGTTANRSVRPNNTAKN